jgi:RTA1 like protein
MLAGLIFQDVSLVLFAIACSDFFLRVRKSKGNWNARYLDITSSRLFKTFLLGLMTATITIFIRSSYRIVELSGGFNSTLFTSDEAIFMIFEGLMIVIATSCLTLLHPAVSFQGAFASANFSFRVKKDARDKSMSSDQESQHSGIPLSMMEDLSRENFAPAK